MNDSKAFTDYSNNVDNVYKIIEEYNPNKKRKTLLLVFGGMITNMLSNKKLNSVVAELFSKGRWLDISLIFITQSFFKGRKDVRLKTTHFFYCESSKKTLTNRV